MNFSFFAVKNLPFTSYYYIATDQTNASNSLILWFWRRPYFSLLMTMIVLGY